MKNKKQVTFNGNNRREVLQFVFPELSETALSGAEIMKLPIVIPTRSGDYTVKPGETVADDNDGYFKITNPAGDNS